MEETISISWWFKLNSFIAAFNRIQQTPSVMNCIYCINIVRTLYIPLWFIYGLRLKVRVYLTDT